MVSGAAGGTGVTTYAENIGVMAATKIYSTAMFVVAALIALLLGFSPKFGALIQAIPLPVMGGVSIVVFGLIAVAGAKIWVDNKVDFSQNKNLIVAAITLIIGTGDFTLKFGQLRARRHRHGDLRRDPALCAAEPLAPGVSAPARHGARAVDVLDARHQFAKQPHRILDHARHRVAAERKAGKADLHAVEIQEQALARVLQAAFGRIEEIVARKHRLRRGTQAVGVEVGLDRPDIEDGLHGRNCATRRFLKRASLQKHLPQPCRNLALLRDGIKCNLVQEMLCRVFFREPVSGARPAAR